MEAIRSVASGNLGDCVCPYCGVGCVLRFDGRPGSIEKVRGVESAPANLGRICAKGAQLGPTIDTSDRLLHPKLRLSRHDQFRTVDWDTALGYVGEIFTGIMNTHGPDAVAFYGSGQLDTETAYLATKLFKGFLGTNNTDSNSRLCMAAAVAGYRSSLGSDAPPGCYDDIELADVVLIIGSNMAEAHPVLFDRLRDAKKARPEKQIVVIDPRRTPTAQHADLHIRVAPGGDIALLNALGRLLLMVGAVATPFVEAHSRGFSEYCQFLHGQNLAELCRTAGVEEAILYRLASLIARSERFLSFYCMGLGQSTVGMWKNNSLINLHLLTGQRQTRRRPFSLTGTTQRHGGSEVGLPRTCFARLSTRGKCRGSRRDGAGSGAAGGIHQPTIGLTAVEIFSARAAGYQGGLDCRHQPGGQLPDLHQTPTRIWRAQLVVVQDATIPPKPAAWRT